MCPVKAQNMSTSPNVSERIAARSLARTSLLVSVAGIVIGTISIIVVVAVIMSYGKHACQFMVDGKCFAYRESLSHEECSNRMYYYDYDSNYCYHH